MKTTKGCLDHILLGEGMIDNIQQKRHNELKKCEKKSNYYRGQIEAIETALPYEKNPKAKQIAIKTVALCKRCLSQRGEKV